MAKAKSKTEKKIDNNIRLALTAACDQFLEDIPGFQWLTHQANYTNFPASLMITCVFDTEESSNHTNKPKIYKVIQSKLLKIGVKFKSPERQVMFDSEEACTHEDDGKWNERLERLKGRSIPKNRPE
ncbi:Fis family transcriptional regulator [uncultured Pseudoteredinibacter sp.]|uniref:Fis family transcriptional regulator n=1 Tax=uncultured Pseudoteredinibacter sp. TaxID=1641701 RepID=UPI002632B0F5|nr:Fis family transcriptional regulator [uncultured Pseudoteredinibacter sp.]